MRYQLGPFRVIWKELSSSPGAAMAVARLTLGAAFGTRASSDPPVSERKGEDTEGHVPLPIDAPEPISAEVVPVTSSPIGTLSAVATRCMRLAPTRFRAVFLVESHGDSNYGAPPVRGSLCGHYGQR